MRISIPAHVLEHHPLSGHGRVWHNVVRELRALARVAVGREPWRTRAWIVDGHVGPVPTRRPVVAQMHETSWDDEMLDPRFREHLERGARATAARADRIVTASEATRSQIASGLDYPLDRIDVVPHGVDVELFRPGLRSPVEGPYVLFAASVHPRKNLRALREAVERVGSHQLVVVAAPAADRPDSAELEAAAFAPLRCGLVRVDRPSDAELAALMAGCDAFVLPSFWEGFGLTALEAMACGAPVIVSDRGPLPEVVGEAGLTCPPDPAGIEAALRRVLGDPDLASHLRTAGRERALGMTWRHTAEGWLESVRRALAQRV